MSLCPLSGSAVYDPHRPRPDRAALRGNAACESRRGSVGGCRQAVHRELEQLHVRARAVPAGAEPRPSTPRSRRRSDYIPLAEFHTLARAISTKDTVHHAYSMNWPLLVKGASVVDLASAPKEARVEALQEGRRMIETRYRDNAWEALLALPPVENALNIVDWALQMLFYYRHACRPPPPRLCPWATTWSLHLQHVQPSALKPPLPLAHRYVKAFFAPARMQDIEKQVPVVEPSFYDPLIRTTSSIFFTFTYDLGTAERFVHNSEQKLRRDKRGAATQAQQCALCGAFETASVAFSHCCANPATHTRACLKSVRLLRCL